MKFLVAFSVFILLHLLGWGAAHAWMSTNKSETLVVVDTSFAMKPHFQDMQLWLENYQDNARYTEVVVGTDKTSLGPLDAIKSRENIFRSAFGTFTAESLDKYSSNDSDKKILLSDGNVKPSGWEVVTFD